MTFRIRRAICLLVFILSCFEAIAQHKVEATHQFTISGLVEKPLTIDIGAIGKYPVVTLEDIVVKNHRGEEKKTAKNVKGILLKTLMDSVHFTVSKPKHYSELVIVLTASDGYMNVYSWNELFNTEIGNHVYIITEKDGQKIDNMDGAIVVVSTSDINAGSRYLKGLSKIEIKKME